MIIELILSNGDTLVCEPTNVSRQEYSTHLSISIKYTYQLPITHKMFEYFKTVNHQFEEIIDEIANHSLSCIIVRADASIFVEKNTFYETLENQCFIDLGKHHRVMNNELLVIGYACNDGTSMIDNLELDVMTDALQKMLIEYASKYIFHQIPDEFVEVVTELPISIKLKEIDECS